MLHFRGARHNRQRREPIVNALSVSPSAAGRERSRGPLGDEPARTRSRSSPRRGRRCASFAAVVWPEGGAVGEVLGGNGGAEGGSDDPAPDDQLVPGPHAGGIE